MASGETVVVTGASQGIGAAIVQGFLKRGYNVVATSRNISKAGIAPSSTFALVDGDIGQAPTARMVVDAAIGKFGSIDAVVNNAGIFSAKSPSRIRSRKRNWPRGWRRSSRKRDFENDE